ncbi:MAG: UDP-N-acetylmuramate dehydrogenase [Parcubacteria group bacterium]|jgi:UDP-N-acetylmuramate dehydrogenase
MLNIQENISLAKYTTFRIGGPARFFVEVENAEEIAEAIEYAQNNKFKFFILGGGCNVLVSDSGFDGLVIRIKNTLFMIHDVSVGCGAGVPLAKVVKDSIESGLTGMEWAAGIPGTVGGAIRGNAGAFGGEMAQGINTVNFIDPAELYEEDNKTVKIKTFSAADCQFAYRNSIFKQNPNLIILSASLRLEKGDRAESEKKVKDILAQRSSNQPKGASAGSYFINPVVSNPELLAEFEKETGQKSRGGKLPSGWLIARAGLRGKKIGGALVSMEHANFIVNTGTATAEDITALDSLVKQQVRDKFGVQLQEEVQYLGFN